MTDHVNATVDVAVDPATAFKIFTEEIDTWWERGPANFYNGARATAMRLEPGLGGRYLEVYDDASGDALEIGRITVWEPGHRLVYKSSLDDTEVDIRFETIRNGTRVLLEQRLVPGGSKAQFLSGWHNILGWYADCADHQEGEPAPLEEMPRFNLVLYYPDPAAAAAWLVRVFGLRPRHLRHMVEHYEVMHGDSVIVLRRSDQPISLFPPSHSMYAYVDDLDAHFERAQAGGARIVEGIHRYGDRIYVAEDVGAHRWTFAQARPTRQRPVTGDVPAASGRQ